MNRILAKGLLFPLVISSKAIAWVFGFHKKPPAHLKAVNVKKRVYKLISQQFKIKPASIHDDLYIKDDLCVDSLELIEFYITLQEEFDVHLINNDKASHIKTLNDLITFIETNR